MPSTARTSFSQMHTTLLSKPAPATMSRPAFTRSAVSSTTQGGLPGPAQMAFFPLAIAAFTTPGPPVTTRRRHPGCFISSPALSMVGSATAHRRFCGPPAPLDGLVQERHQPVGDPLRVRDAR